MKASSIIICVVTAIIGLLTMCLCSLIFSAEWNSFFSFLTFIFFTAVIAAIMLRNTNSKGSKIAALCVIIGLIGIAAMQLSNLLIPPPYSSFAGFAVFIIFAFIIAAILINQKKYFNAQYRDTLKESCKHDAAIRLIQTLLNKGVSDSEIGMLISEKFNYSSSEAAEMLNNMKQEGKI